MVGGWPDVQAPWHCLNFLPEPQGQGALRGVLSQSDLMTGVLTGSGVASGGAPAPSSWAWAAAAAPMVLGASLGSLGALYWTLPSSASSFCWSTTETWACMTYFTKS